MSFASQLQEEIDSFYLEVNEITKEVARSVMKEVVANTVIDTAQAVSNWQLQLDSANKEFVPPYLSGSKGSTAVENEKATLSEAESNLKGRVLGQPIFITNNIQGSEDYDYNSQVLIAESVAVESAEEAVALAEVKFRNR